MATQTKVEWLSTQLSGPVGGGPPDRVRASQTSTMSNLADFAAAFPADALDGSPEQTDYISFKAFSNKIPGYTAVSGGERGADGEGATVAQYGILKDLQEPQGNVKLFIPETVANSTKSNYEGTNNGSAIAGAMNILANDQSGDHGAGWIAKMAGFTGDATVDALLVGAQQLGESGDIAAQASGMSTAAANRHVIFRGIEYRSFSYQYNIMPKSASESAKLADIIKWFRIQMLPDKGDTGNFFTPPNFFTIDYIINGAPAEYMHKIKPSVLTDCEVTYGGNGSFGKFKNTGAPSVIALNLTFQEVQLVSKIDAAMGY
jgi:hypothetical protein